MGVCDPSRDPKLSTSAGGLLGALAHSGSANIRSWSSKYPQYLHSTLIPFDWDPANLFIVLFALSLVGFFFENMLNIVYIVEISLEGLLYYFNIC